MVRVKKVAFACIVSGIILIVAIFAINVHMLWSTNAYMLPQLNQNDAHTASAVASGNTVTSGSMVVSGNDDVDCLIVFGALVRDTGVSLILQDRLDAAFAYWKLHPKVKIIVSGDHGRKEYDEVNAMREYLESKGVPGSLIFMDHAGFNTYETLYRARDVFKVESAVLVTQKYHLTRAVYVGRALGMDMTGLPADARIYFKMPKYMLREYLARTKDFFNVHVMRPEPTFLGPEIPIRTSDGSDTHDGK